MRRPAEGGASVIECAAALALAAATFASSSSALILGSRLARAVEVRGELLGAARGAMEAELGSPCRPVDVCPAAYRCSVSREGLALAGLERVVARAVDDATGEAEELRTLRRLPACGG